jgi:uncharacterized protein (DUF1697 family)
MKIYIAILRGINVSGHKPIKMDALRAMCEQLNFKNAKTYIQSGNIVFQYKQTNTETLEKLISKKIKETFTFDVPVLVKDADELKLILKNNPFVNKRNEDITKLHVTFLSHQPEKINCDKIKEGNYGADEFIISGKNIYLFCPVSYGNSKLSNTFLENKLKVTATTRNWKTINELVVMADF